MACRQLQSLAGEEECNPGQRGYSKVPVFTLTTGAKTLHTSRCSRISSYFKMQSLLTQPLLFADLTFTSFWSVAGCLATSLQRCLLWPPRKATGVRATASAFSRCPTTCLSHACMHKPRPCVGSGFRLQKNRAAMGSAQNKDVAPALYRTMKDSCLGLYLHVSFHNLHKAQRIAPSQWLFRTDHMLCYV